MELSEFVNAYCERYELTEDELDNMDVVYIESCWFSYEEGDKLPDFMQIKLRIT